MRGAYHTRLASLLFPTQTHITLATPQGQVFIRATPSLTVQPTEVAPALLDFKNRQPAECQTCPQAGRRDGESERWSPHALQDSFWSTV